MGRFTLSALTLVAAAGALANLWSSPITLVGSHGRLAVGNRLHVVGHTGSNLVHRSSTDSGATWGTTRTIAPASGNFPMQYGGLWASGDTVYLITAAGDMGPSSKHIDFRRSTDNGTSWSSPIRITAPGQELRRANIVVSGNTVHVFGGQSGAGGYGTGIFYFRSLNGGSSFEPGRLLYANADASTRLAVDGDILHVAFGDKVSPSSFGGRTSYLRSSDNGTTWSSPVLVGEVGVQARQQVVAGDGKALTMYQRERSNPDETLPEDRLGYNLSLDGGITWIGPALLPEGTGIDRNHHQLWLTPGGGLHVAFLNGPTEPASGTGYMFSPDCGLTWLPGELALNTSVFNLPHNIVADGNWVHILAEPGAGTYVRRRVPKSVHPTSFSVGTGTHLYGDLTSLTATDDEHLVFLTSYFATPIDVIFEGSAPVASASAMTLTFETSMTASATLQVLRLFDFTTNSWEVVDSRPGSLVDKITQVSPMNPARFLEPGTGRLRARLEVSSSMRGQRSWRLKLDLLRWSITP